MSRCFLIGLLLVCFPVAGGAQEIPPVTEQQLENLADMEQAETEDDTYLQQLVQFSRNPLNLNTAEKDELRELRVLTDLQIENFLSYRRLLGMLLHLYELQAVPGWDMVTIRKVLPYVTVSSPLLVKEDMQKRLKGGEHVLLLRASQVIERSAGFAPSVPGTKYLGSPQRLFFRYRYQYKNLLQFGLLGDKDAGEQFFSGAQKSGFDFYSFHLFARKVGSIQALALGDFTVNMGQGLIQWQSLAFKKSADIMGVKRQSPVLRPYNAAGEYNFHRGAGITIRKGKLEATGFLSFRKLSSNLVTDSNTTGSFFSSFQLSGYHRTQSEIDDRNKLQQLAAGGAARYTGQRWHFGINGMYYKFSMPLQKRDEPYNLFAISGDSWYNVSMEYSYTRRNFHVFGEAAIDKNLHKAVLNGLLISADPKVDISLVHRVIAKDYQAINGNAFTENLLPSNENGLYAGITIRPVTAWRVDAYADIYRFPWLKFRVDAPGSGRDFFIQLTYTPNRQTEIYTRFRNESKQGNDADNVMATHAVVFLPKQNWRTQISYKVNSAVTLRNRAELVWYDNKSEKRETGFLTYLDCIYRPLMKPLSGIVRLQYFETDGYNARLYAYENDVLYSYSIPVFFDKGYRYYFLLNYDITRKISLWIRWAQTIYPGKEMIGSGTDEIAGNKKTEIKLQARCAF